MVSAAPPHCVEEAAAMVELKKDDTLICSKKTIAGNPCKNKVCGDGEVLCHVHLKKKNNTHIGRGIPTYFYSNYVPNFPNYSNLYP
jgi:hypothetical protein